ncbi:hypothetical protein K502DRAFT_325172, partial [Neoconidiobolus thromboides FSU 785]
MDSNSPLRPSLSNFNSTPNTPGSTHSRASSSNPPFINLKTNSTSGLRLDTSLKSLSSPLENIVDDEDLNSINEKQEENIHQLRDIIIESKQFHELANQKYYNLSNKFDHHTLKIQKFQSELQLIFKRIRTIKSRLASQHPSILKQIQLEYPDIEVED